MVLTNITEMKVRLLVISMFFINVLIVSGHEIFTPPIKTNTAFKAGESLTYQIRYGFVVGGVTTLNLTEDVYKKKSVFHATAIGQTTGMAEKLYGVKDIYQSWFDKETNLPYKKIRDIHKGSYQRYNEVTYNRINNTVNSKLSGIHRVPRKILDLSSAFYYLRRVDFTKIKVGDASMVNMYFSDEIFPFRFKYIGKEMIRTKFGKINCIKINPLVEVGRMFKTQQDLTIWFTDDEICLPVLVRMDIRVVGSVLLKLIKYENITNPMIFQN